MLFHRIKFEQWHINIWKKTCIIRETSWVIVAMSYTGSLIHVDLIGVVFIVLNFKTILLVHADFHFYGKGISSCVCKLQRNLCANILLTPFEFFWFVRIFPWPQKSMNQGPGLKKLSKLGTHWPFYNMVLHRSVQFHSG